MKKLLVEVLGDDYGKISRITDNGQTWYKAQDVCRILGLVNTSVAVRGSNVRLGYFGIDREDIYRQSPCKTNTEFELGKRVILTWMVEKGWNRGKFRVNYHRDKHLTALDNVFYMIDGKGPIKSYHGPLYDAITDSPDGTGKTEYFKFRCCINGNLHLEFLKPALVAKLNAIAGGNRLRK
jgi:hypothetical protein